MKVKHVIEESIFSDANGDLYTILGVNDFSAYYFCLQAD